MNPPHTPTDCRRAGCGDCALIATNAAYAASLRPAAPRRPAPKPAAAGVCPHLGGQTGETVACASCAKSTPQTMPVYRCGLHGLTVVGDRRPKSNAVAACRWCPDRPTSAGGPG